MCQDEGHRILEVSEWEYQIVELVVSTFLTPASLTHQRQTLPHYCNSQIVRVGARLPSHDAVEERDCVVESDLLGNLLETAQHLMVSILEMIQLHTSDGLREV